MKTATNRVEVFPAVWGKPSPDNLGCLELTDVRSTGEECIDMDDAYALLEDTYATMMEEADLLESYSVAEIMGMTEDEICSAKSEYVSEGLDIIFKFQGDFIPGHRLTEVYSKYLDGIAKREEAMKNAVLVIDDLMLYLTTADQVEDIQYHCEKALEKYGFNKRKVFEMFEKVLCIREELFSDAEDYCWSKDPKIAEYGHKLHRKSPMKIHTLLQNVDFRNSVHNDIASNSIS